MAIQLFSAGESGGVQNSLLFLPLLVVVVLLGIAVQWVVEIWWKPLRITQAFEAQGITGPSYKILVGNLLDMKKMILSDTLAPPIEHEASSHKIDERIAPHLLLWSKTFGDPFLFWWGIEPRLAITNSEVMKEVLLNKEGKYEKIALAVRFEMQDMFGDGLAVADGEKWFDLRRLFNPFFHVGKIKAMKSTMETSVLQLMTDWHEKLKLARINIIEIDVHREFQNLSADIMSQTVFGSSCREEGRRIVELLGAQQRLTMEALMSFKFPGSRYLPTARNRLKRKLMRKVDNTLLQIIQKRLESAEHEEGANYKSGSDLLGHMLFASIGMQQLQDGSNENSYKVLSTKDIIDQCKMFFFAGYETTSLLLTWTLMLLAMNPEWQQRLRTEVEEVCKNNIPKEEELGQLKYMAMVLLETLRLYPPTPNLSRFATKTTNIGNLTIPKGTTITYNGIVANHSEVKWGKDAHKFNPERFNSGADHKHQKAAFWPFSLGPRSCIGHSFAMQEAKLTLAMALQRFSWELSPTYDHAPTLILTLHPQHGMPLVIKPLPNKLESSLT